MSSIMTTQPRCGVTAARQVHTLKVRFNSGVRNQAPLGAILPRLLSGDGDTPVAGPFYSSAAVKL